MPPAPSPSRVYHHPKRVVFAPDWRRNPYQQRLAEALAAEGVMVEFLTHYRRGLPLTRGIATLAPALLHLHWPEAYFHSPKPITEVFRQLRFGLDLGLATRRLPLVITAHNLLPHRSSRVGLDGWNMRLAYRRAEAVLVHSRATIPVLQARHGVSPERCHYIPHGDPAQGWPPLPSAAEARVQLGLKDDLPIVLCFGLVAPYKGLEEPLAWWASQPAPAARLVIAGQAKQADYVALLQERAKGLANVTLDLQWQSDERLRAWLAAASVVLINYPKILTSGAALLARAVGVPLLVAEHLTTLDLGEPSPLVQRFGPANFSAALAKALASPRDPLAVSEWRQAVSWQSVAQRTAAVYGCCLGGRS